MIQVSSQMINSSTQLDESNLSSPKVNSINKNQQRFVKQLSLYSQSPSQTPKFHNFKEENNKRNSPKCENNSQRIPIYHKNENHIVDIYSFCQLQKQQLQEQYQKNKTLDSLASSFHTLFTTEDVIQLLEQPLDQRRIKGLRQMRIYFQEYQFFQNLLAQEGQEFVNQCTDNLTCKSFKKNTLMFNSSLGEIEPDVRGVMILIKGKCRVFYDRECSLKYILNQKCDFEENSKLVSEGFTLGAYEYEQDSVRQSQNKIYSIYCEEFCEFAFLDKQSFSQIKLLKFRQEKRELIEFFRSISIFQNFEDMTLVEVILQCEKQNFNRMQYVYKDGDDSNYIYFVFEGEFRLNKQRRANSSQELESDQRQINDPHHNKKLLAMIPKQFIQKNQQNQDKLPASSIQQSADDKNTFHNKKLKDLYSQMLQKKKKKWSQKQDQITLIIYERGTFFGEKEIIDDLQNQESISFHKNKKKREFSIQCMSDQGICYRFSYFKFLKLINNHRQIFTHLSELNDQLNEWINHRIEQVLNPQILTSQVQEVSQSQQLKQIKWKQEQDEVKAKLLEQHKAATKYLQQTLNQLQVRIKREDKERNLKVSNIARELTKLRESRHQFLHLNLIERKKKEHLVISKLEQQSQSKIKGSPRNQDCQLELNQLSNTIKRPSLHNENSQSSTFVRSKVDIQLTQNEENYLTPQYLTQKSISAESQKQQTSKIDLLANKSSHVLPKNYKETTKQIKCSQSTKNLNTVSLSPIRNIKQTSKNQEIQVKQRNSSNNQDRQLSSEYSSGNQGQESIKKKRVISFLKREQQTNYLPQFFIKSSIPLQEYQLKNSQINNLSSSMSTDQNQSTLILRENQILNQSDNLRKSSKSKVTHLNINETETSNKNLITKASYPKLYTQSGNGFIPNKCISSSSKKQHQSIMRYITQPHQIDDSFEMIPLKTCISYNTQPYENLQNLASANQNINCNKYQINILDSNSFIVKSRSITNSDQKFINFQSLTNDSSSFKSKDLDTKMESYFKMKDTSPTKIQKLPLKYFVNQYKIVQKHHLGMKNYNLKKQPTDQSSLKIVSPRLQPSPI
ncbi:cyclic nucleotide-binding domain protein (macronuclear) [Tetrahymena thermophila SB210]|uniref:Cyclic nucleotide-binding domain protein n=1 Tax=Tetrahymena thermophila (strain SB210) TaxID=312017 RepID=I7LXE6_TETTS|nr:cyclic nucleotide-binding domain protein [Tetrahymena thermophila SB210]EAS04481.1 cyclic nucleotide-binding domain protein [Tetrahymena thermophila SB210]|eukprot:XP_001024726.1 cyclic nucleotide-binding domain protein [Tetrahymena thermophila SB210]